MYLYIKRLLDILAAIILLTFLSAPLLIVAIWIKLDSRGPILFRQVRAGKNLAPFEVYKFRSMSVDAPNNRPTGDFNDAGAYITRSGRIMRKLSIDELPQLVNVLKNDMSMIGPRPIIPNEVSLFEERAKYGANAVKPGITGWAQANGRDELTNAEKALMDGHYVSNLSFSMDMRCLAKTAWTVVSADGNKDSGEREAITAGDMHEAVYE